MSTPAIDLQERSLSLDVLDATDATARNLQSALGLAQNVAAVLRFLAAPGAGYFVIPSNYADLTTKKVDATEQAAYEVSVAAAIVGITAAVVNLMTVVNFVPDSD